MGTEFIDVINANAKNARRIEQNRLYRKNRRKEIALNITKTIAMIAGAICIFCWMNVNADEIFAKTRWADIQLWDATVVNENATCFRTIDGHYWTIEEPMLDEDGNAMFEQGQAVNIEFDGCNTKDRTDDVILGIKAGKVDVY